MSSYSSREYREYPKNRYYYVPYYESDHQGYSAPRVGGRVGNSKYLIHTVRKIAKYVKKINFQNTTKKYFDFSRQKLIN